MTNKSKHLLFLIEIYFLTDKGGDRGSDAIKGVTCVSSPVK